MLICLSLFFNCNENKDKSEESLPLEVSKEPIKLIVSVEYKSDISDFFQCTFSNIELGDNTQTGNYTITQKINSSDELKTTNFKMFGDYISSKIQLKLGKKPKKMVINNITLSYDDQKVIVDGLELDRYFTMNNYVLFNKETKTIETKTINNKHIPVLNFRQGFIRKLFNLE